jgi:hypothetical protein
MKCQLARIINSEEYPKMRGRLIWVVAGPPENKAACHYYTGERLTRDCRFDVAYMSNRKPGLFMACQADVLELLPYFSDRDVANYEEWMEKGGESLPEDV